MCVCVCFIFSLSKGKTVKIDSSDLLITQDNHFLLFLYAYGLQQEYRLLITLHVVYKPIVSQIFGKMSLRIVQKFHSLLEM